MGAPDILLWLRCSGGLICNYIRALCGSQDYGALLRTHRENDADITIATHAVGRKQASLRGITRVNPDSGARPFVLAVAHAVLAGLHWFGALKLWS